MFKSLIHRPIAVFTVLIATLILGIAVMRQLPVSLVPEVDIPLITIKVSDSETSARELNEMAIDPLRSQLIQVSNLKEISTQSKDGSGIITMEFEYGVNMDLLFVEVNEKIDRAISSLPKEMERPKVIRASATDLPAFYINVSLKNKSDKLNPDNPSGELLDMSTFVKEVVVRRIEQIPQVAMVDISGVINSEILIVPNEGKLKMAGVTESQLVSAIEGADVTLGNLTIRDGEYSFNVRFESKLIDKKDIEEIYLKIDGRIYQFKDLCSVILQSSDRSGIVLNNGQEALTMAVIKRSEAKMADLRSEINDLMVQVERDYPELEFTLTRDQTALLDYSINNLISNILMGALLACIVIFFFMQDFRSPLLVVFTIPSALIISFLFFYIIGISINIISLAGLVIGIGMMVDNSIVTIDNITFRWKSGLPLDRACVEGTKEVFMPMLSSVLTTCAVFIPLVFLSGISGALFYDQAMAVTIVLFSALAVTALVLPTFYHLLYRNQVRFTPNKFLQRIVSGNLTNLYEKALKWNFRRRWIMWSIFILAIVGIMGVFMVIKKEKLPPMSYNDALVSIEWNQRISAQENSLRCNKLVEELGELVEESTVIAGVHQFLMAHTAEQTISESVIYIKTSSVDDVLLVQEKIKERVESNYPEAVVEFSSSGNIFDMIFASNEASLTANIRPTTGTIKDLNLLDEVLRRINIELSNIDVPNAEWQEHIEFVPRPEMMALYNVSYNEVLSILRKALRSNNIMTISTGTQILPIVLGGDKKELGEIISKTVVEKDEYSVPLDVLLRQTNSRDLKSITSGGDGEYYKLDLYIADNDIIPTINTIESIVNSNDNFEVDFTGAYFSNIELIKELIYVLIISILLLYFILSAQFESLTQPLIILFELIIDIFGAIFFLWLFDVSINLMSLIGIVVMCGIVINDSILKVDTINKLRESGYGVLRAVMEAGARRLKPILMTSITTILSMVPFLLTGDMGSDLQYPLAVAVISGMVVGTLVSVLYVPLVYFEIYKKQYKRAKNG